MLMILVRVEFAPVVAELAVFRILQQLKFVDAYEVVFRHRYLSY